MPTIASGPRVEIVAGVGDLARLVRLARLQQHLSQGALAERIGITRQAVANLESGRTVPSMATAVAAVRALGMQLQVVTGTAHVREATDVLQTGDSAHATVRRGPVDLDAVLGERPAARQR